MDLIWAPQCMEKLDDSIIRLYLDFSSSPCIRNGGCDIDHALEILHQSNGDIKLAMKQLLALGNDAKGIKNFWSVEEVQCFEEYLQVFGKNFFLISERLKTKSVKECVKFYYLWKKSSSSSSCSNTSASSSSSSFRAATSSSISSSSTASTLSVSSNHQQFQQVVGDETNNNGNLTISSSDSNNNSSSSSASFNNGNGTNDLFLCKVCGRAFEKIKSRSAHMKRHKNERPR